MTPKEQYEARKAEHKKLSDMRIERPAKTRCPTCGRLFKCVDAHHLVKHGRFINVSTPGDPSDG